MPNINKVFTLEVTPERFLQACSPGELHEVELLLQSPRFRNRMGDEIPDASQPATPEIAASNPDDYANDFFKVVEELYNEGTIRAGTDFYIAADMLYLRVTYKLYSLFEQRRHKEGKFVANSSTTAKAIEAHPAFMKKANRYFINEGQQKCYLFAYSSLGIDLNQA